MTEQAAGEPVPAASRRGLGAASLVLGVLGLLSSWLLVGLLPAGLAVVLGLVGRRRAARGAGGGRLATCGAVLGAVAIPLGVALYLVARHYVQHHCYPYDDGDRRTHARCD